MHQHRVVILHVGNFIWRVPEQAHGVAAEIGVAFRYEVEDIKDDRAEFGNLTNEALTFTQWLDGGALFCLGVFRVTRFRGPSLRSGSGFAHFSEPSSRLE